MSLPSNAWFGTGKNGIAQVAYLAMLGRREALKGEEACRLNHGARKKLVELVIRRVK